jgi:hypothetical protein
MAVGFFFFLPILGIGPILMGGVTHWVGEGQIALPESPEQIRLRLGVIGILTTTAAVGWILTRLGDSYWERVGPRPRAVQLLAEVLMLFGGISLAIALMVAWGHRIAAYPVVDDYRRLGIGAAIAGPILFGFGWILYRRSARYKTPSKDRSSTDACHLNVSRTS